MYSTQSSGTQPHGGSASNTCRLRKRGHREASMGGSTWRAPPVAMFLRSDFSNTATPSKESCENMLAMCPEGKGAGLGEQAISELARLPASPPTQPHCLNSHLLTGLSFSSLSPLNLPFTLLPKWLFLKQLFGMSLALLSCLSPAEYSSDPSKIKLSVYKLKCTIIFLSMTKFNFNFDLLNCQVVEP